MIPEGLSKCKLMKRILVLEVDKCGIDATNRLWDKLDYYKLCVSLISSFKKRKQAEHGGEHLQSHPLGIGDKVIRK